MISIRKASKTDVDSIHALGEHVPEFFTSDATVNFWPKEILTAGIDSEDVILLVAEDENRIVGFLIVNCNHTLSKALIENIFVAPEYRGLGIATTMIKKAIELFTKRGFEYVCVLTPPDDIAAISSYEKAGFVKGETFLWLDLSFTELFRV